jgi:DNA polymerase III sliding clamp (beta) subunit (PCNA family)
MKFSIDANILDAALATVGEAVTSVSRSHSLSNVLVEVADNSHLTLSSTDMCKGASWCVRLGDKAEAGRVALPYHDLKGLIAGLRGHQIEIATDGQTTHIHGGGSDYHLLTANPDDFPPLPEPAQQCAFGLPGAKLTAMLRFVAGSADNIDSCGDSSADILLHHTSTYLRVTATDSHRVAVAQDLPFMSKGAPPKTEAGIDGNKFALSLLAAQSISRICEQSKSEAVHCYYDTRKASFRFDDGSWFHSNLIDASSFPPYEKIIELPRQLVGMVERKPLMEALRRIRRITDFRKTSACFKFTGVGLCIDAKGELGSGHEEVEADVIAPLAGLYAPNYWAQGLAALREDAVRVESMEYGKGFKMVRLGTDEFIYCIAPRSH